MKDRESDGASSSAKRRSEQTVCCKCRSVLAQQNRTTSENVGKKSANFGDLFNVEKRRCPPACVLLCLQEHFLSNRDRSLRFVSEPCIETFVLPFNTFLPKRFVLLLGELLCKNLTNTRQHCRWQKRPIVTNTLGRVPCPSSRNLGLLALM